MPSIHSVARAQHLKQERKQYKMNNQITLKQLLLVTTTDTFNVYLKDVNAMNITRLLYDHTSDLRDVLNDYLDYIVESVNENFDITIKSQKIV
jgi:hypothetical protein